MRNSTEAMASVVLLLFLPWSAYAEPETRGQDSEDCHSAINVRSDVRPPTASAADQRLASMAVIDVVVDSNNDGTYNRTQLVRLPEPRADGIYAWRVEELFLEHPGHGKSRAIARQIFRGRRIRRHA